MQPKTATQAMSEYGEPWKEDGCCAWADNGEGVRVADCWTSGKATCDRIVACVNAMQGIPNPEAVRELVEAAQLVSRVYQSYGIVSDETMQQLRDTVTALSAPSTGAQQK